MSEGPNGLIAFVHIPKTAGGTATTMFTAGHSQRAVKNAGNYFTGPQRVAQKLHRQFRAWSAWQQRGGRMTVGHVPYAIFREHLSGDFEPVQGVSYITFLRDPVERVLSHYYRHFHRRNPERAGHVKIRTDGKPQKSRADSLEQAMVDMGLPQLNNLCTRFLCDDPSPERLPESAIDEAKANLSEFAFIGVTERFHESMALLRRTFSLEAAPYDDRHVNANRPGAEQIPADQRALIVEYNAMDVELYRVGLALFEDALAKADAGLTDEAEQLRALNEGANDEADQELNEARRWLNRELPPGSTKPVESLLTAGEAAGFQRRVLKRASRRLGATKLHRGERAWVRPAEDGS